MRRGGFRGGAMRGGARGYRMGRGRFWRPYGRFWGRPYRSFLWWRPFWWYPIWWRPLHWLPWTMMMGGFMFLLYDQMAYKLHQDDVDRVERAAGKPVRDLSEDELVGAMRRLGIQKLEITPGDRDAIAQSGKPARDLSRDDLIAAMKRLGIQKLEVTPKPRESRQATARYCIHCGTSLASNAAYCARCGKPT